MFEAHYNPTSETAAPCWAESALDRRTSQHAATGGDKHTDRHLHTPTEAQQGLSRRIQSLRHACPLHAWAALGKRKDASGQVHEQWFLYIEYCTGRGTRIWQKLERTQAGCSLDALFALACQAELPGIDSECTRLWLKTHRGH